MTNFSLNSGVSKSHKLVEDDVLKVKRALLKLGYYRIPDYGLTPYSDDAMFYGVKRFQKDNGLLVDGEILPDYDTETALAQALRQRQGTGTTSQSGKEADRLAAAGRNGDTEIGHLTPGEIVLPKTLLTPDLVAKLDQELRRAGLDLGR